MGSHDIQDLRRPEFPDRIIIYKKSIEAVSRDRKSLDRTIKRVVLHEIGHYFGLDEKRLRELGLLIILAFHKHTSR